MPVTSRSLNSYSPGRVNVRPAVIDRVYVWSGWSWLIVSSSTSCLPATKPVDGGQGSVMTVASLPFSRKQARPYQVISIGQPMVAPRRRRRPGDSTSPGARPMTPGLEGGRVEAETRVDLHLARRRLESPSKPRACRTLRNLNLYGHVRSAWQNAPQCLSPSAS